MKKKLLFTTISAGLVLVLSSCGKTTVAYEDPNDVDTTSINFSSTDLQAINKMAEDILIHLQLKGLLIWICQHCFLVISVMKLVSI